MSEDTVEPVPCPEHLPNNRVKTPTVIQMEAVECGAAALGIILSYYGRHVPLETLRMECGVSRDGSKANNVLRAARNLGLEAKGFRHELETLLELKTPAILFWNFNHFLVLEGFKNGKVYLNDPACGPRVVSWEELDASFSGVVLTFEKTDAFEKGGEPPKMRDALARRLASSKPALTYAVVAGLLLVVPGLVIPTFSRLFIDDVLVGGEGSLLQPLLMGMVLTAVLRGALTYMQEYYLLRMETRLALSHASQFFYHILRLPVSYFSQRYAGEVGSRVLINDKIAKLISGQLTTMILDCLLVVFYGLLMLTYDVVLTLVCIGLAVINIAVVKLAGRMRVDASRRLMQEQGKLVGTAMGGLSMIETLKATGAETEFFARWAGYQAKALKAQQDLGKIAQYVSIVPPLINTLTTTAILVLGGMRVMDGALTVGMLVAFQSLMASFSRPINTLVQFGGAIQELEADMNRIDDVLNYPQDVKYHSEPEMPDSLKKIVKLSGRIEFKDLSFGYSPLEPALIEGFNLTIEPGQRVALVGGSGSGKSTVAKILSGLYQPWEGQVLFDGVSRSEIPSKLIHDSVAMVDQEVFLFQGSVSENLSMWDSTMPDVKVTNACRDAEIDEVIQTRPGGYKSGVEEGGTNFSGGQAQRLEIARALVGDPTVLILDEATSALDSNTERAIDDHVRRRGCTCVIIAHRLSTIRDCDQIIVMDRGKIVQRGTHNELIGEDGGLYSRLMSG